MPKADPPLAENCLIQNCDSLFPINFSDFLAIAAEGGEMGSDYLQDIQPYTYQ